MSENELPRLSGQEFLKFVREGKAVLGVCIEKIDIKNEVFASPVNIENCTLECLTLESCVFKSAVSFKNVTFKGNVDLNREPGQTVFEYDIIFDGCVFEGELHGKGTRFSGKALWEGAKFTGRVALAAVQFNGQTSFAKAQFLESSRFEETCFNKESNFEETLFKGKPNFKRASFAESVYFRKAVFEDGANFENCSFEFARFEDMHSHKKITFKVSDFRFKGYFHRSKFEDQLSFRGCQVHDNIYLSHMICKASVDFTSMEAFNMVTIEETQFMDTVSFAKCIFHHDVYLRGTTFEKLVDFEGSIFDLRLDCSQVNFNERVELYSSNPSVFVIEREQIEGKITSELDKNYEHAKKVFLLLRRNFEFAGNHEDADWAYYKFRQSERRAEKAKGVFSYVKKFMNWIFFDLGCGYGTKPLNVAILATAVILVFSLFYWYFGDQMVIDPKLRIKDDGVSLPQAFYISAMTFTTLGTDGIGPCFDTWLKYLIVAEGFLGLFLMTVFVGVYTRKMVK